MRVLITGAGGQVARSLVERGAGRAWLELIPTGRQQLDLEIPGHACAAALAIRPDVIVAAAAYTAVDQAEDEPQRAFRINGEAMGELARAATRIGARLIYISTDYVYDGAAPQPYKEEAAPLPVSVYGQSKLLGEERARAACPDTVIVRTSWIYSPFGRNFIRTMLSLSEMREEVRVVADQRGSPSHAFVVADGLLTILEAWAQKRATGLGETYHLAGTGHATWFELARHALQCAAELDLPAARVVPISTADWPTKATRPANSMLDTSKFEAQFGYAAPDWRQSVTQLVSRLAAERKSLSTKR